MSEKKATRECDFCDGKGYTIDRDMDGNRYREPCDVCDGTGRREA